MLRRVVRAQSEQKGHKRSTELPTNAERGTSERDCHQPHIGSRPSPSFGSSTASRCSGWDGRVVLSAPTGCESYRSSTESKKRSLRRRTTRSVHCKTSTISACFLRLSTGVEVYTSAYTLSLHQLEGIRGEKPDWRRQDGPEPGRARDGRASGSSRPRAKGSDRRLRASGLLVSCVLVKCEESRRGGGAPSHSSGTSRRLKTRDRNPRASPPTDDCVIDSSISPNTLRPSSHGLRNSY